MRIVMKPFVCQLDENKSTSKERGGKGSERRRKGILAPRSFLSSSLLSSFFSKRKLFSKLLVVRPSRSYPSQYLSQHEGFTAYRSRGWVIGLCKEKEKIARRLIVQSLAKHTITLNRPLDSMIKEYGLSVLQFNI